MSSPEPDEVLFAYIIVAPYTVSLVLIRADCDVSKSLHLSIMAEFTEPPIEELESAENMDEKLVGTISQYDFLAWEVYVDGASN